MFGLPDPGRYRLERAPLAQALVQVRFDLRARLQSLEGVAAFQEAIEGLYPYMEEEQLQQINMLVGVGASPQAQAEAIRHWKFSDESGWTVTLAPDVATLAIGNNYSSVDEIKERFGAVLQALSSRAGVRRCTRLGVRYINIAEGDPSDPHAWATWFRPELVGWAGGDVMAGDLSLALTQVQARARPEGALSGPPADVQAIIRHGLLPPQTLIPGVPPNVREEASFVIDLDLFVEAPQPLDPGALMGQFELLHGQIDRFFRWTLTTAGAEHFGLREIS